MRKCSKFSYNYMYMENCYVVKNSPFLQHVCYVRSLLLTYSVIAVGLLITSRICCRFSLRNNFSHKMISNQTVYTCECAVIQYLILK